MAYFRKAVDLSTPVKSTCDKLDSTSIVLDKLQKERFERLRLDHIKFVPVKSAFDKLHLLKSEYIIKEKLRFESSRFAPTR